MIWDKRILVWSMVMAGLNACGSGGGSGEDSPEGPNQSPTNEQSPAPNSKTNSPKTTASLAVISLDELMKQIGASDFAPTAISEEDIYTRVHDVESLTAYGSKARALGRVDVSMGSDGSPKSCAVSGMDPFRFMGRGMSGIDDMSIYFYNGFKETSDTSHGLTTTHAKLKDVPSFATFAFSYGSDEKNDRGHTVRSRKAYIGITADQVVQATVETTYINDKLDSMINCARIYTKSTLLLKTSCSTAAQSLGSGVQLNNVSDETFRDGLYAFKDTHAMIKLDNPIDRVTTVTSYSEQSGDVVAFDVLEQRWKQPEAHVSGTMKLNRVNNNYTCLILTGTKL